jgi:hypothetical protein
MVDTEWLVRLDVVLFSLVETCSDRLTNPSSNVEATSKDLAPPLCPNEADILRIPSLGFSSGAFSTPCVLTSSLFKTRNDDTAGGFSIVSKIFPEDFLRKALLPNLMGM